MTALAALHVARKQLGLDEDTYRAVLERATGKRSAGDMSEAERQLALEEFRRQGFKPASKGRRKALEGKYAPKLQALWIAGWNLGVVRNRDDAALLAFVKRQTGLDHTRFLHHAEDAVKAIEAVKKWLAREAGVDWTVEKSRPPSAQCEGFKIAWAQWKRLGNGTDIRGFWRTVGEAAGANRAMTAETEWIPVMNALGRRVRATRKETSE